MPKVNQPFFHLTISQQVWNDHPQLLSNILRYAQLYPWLTQKMCICICLCYISIMVKTYTHLSIHFSVFTNVFIASIPSSPCYIFTIKQYFCLYQCIHWLLLYDVRYLYHASIPSSPCSGHLTGSLSCWPPMVPTHRCCACGTRTQMSMNCSATVAP